jgi:phenylacetate-CoA ligase
MPFIRYQVGDIGALSSEPCTCGRGLPLLARIEGRTTDVMIFKGGISLSGPATTLIFKSTRFRHYQLVQMSDTDLLVRVVSAHQDTDHHVEDMNHVENTLKAHLPTYVQIEWEFVDEIPVSPSGKHRFFISRDAGEHLRLSDA